MIHEAKEVVRNFVNNFSSIHKQDPREGYTMLISSFITCFGILSPGDRYKCISTLTILIKDVNDILFEDGQDFISFLKEKTIEKGKQP